MTAAALMICTTLVTNGADGTTATLACSTPEQAEAASLAETVDNFSLLLNNGAVGPDQPLPSAAANPQPIVPQEPKAVAVAAPVPVPVQVKQEPLAVARQFRRPKHVRVAVASPHHHHYRSWRKHHLVAEVVPDKPPTLWDKLKQLNPFNAAEGSN
jgi:hypothetical protein